MEENSRMSRPDDTQRPSLIQLWEALFLRFFNEIGQLTLNLWQSLHYIATLQIDVKKTLVQVASVGFDSLPMSLLICVIAGSVLALQMSIRFAQSGTDSYVGGLVALAIIREIGPIFTCLAVGARAGTAIAAEIANMKVTEQVDALRVLRVDPIRYLMVPRILACIIALPMLTILGEAAGILGGMVVAQAVSNLHYSKYIDSVWLFIKVSDIRFSLIKAIIFGVILATISCTIGLNARGGAKDVGLSTTRAVVWISITIIIADFLLTWMFFGPGTGN
jgi:phospholipid/cholesterol/gamma-HCH transport system permease protein